MYGWYVSGRVALRALSRLVLQSSGLLCGCCRGYYCMSVLTHVLEGVILQEG